VGAYDSPEYEWGTASSPILYKDLALFQCDQQKGSFLIALDRKTRKTVWKTERDELPSWGTPTIVPSKGRAELVTNGSNFVRGYDPATGKELWRLGGSSKITAPTPVYSGDLIVVASGRRPEAPVFVIRAGGNGDITGTSAVLWQKQQRGSYMPTPLIYGAHLYVLNNNGVLDCYDLKSGKDVYRHRIEHQGSGFSASPVASDGNIFLPGEDGEVWVVKAGATYQQAAKNDIGEPIMATPAISKGLLLVRTQHHLWAIGTGQR
jgi:outer membrane protein assembly factor BamB